MFKEDIRNAIFAQSASAAVDLGLKRQALVNLPHEAGFATVVTGVRRCGKSTLLRQWAHDSTKKVVSVLFDDLRLLDFSPSDFILLGKILEEEKAEAVILDEIQDVNGWERFVAGLLLRAIPVFVTGSNAKMLSRELGTKLTGRHLDLSLTPFSFTEYLAFRKRRPSAASFRSYLNEGGFPAFLRAGNRQILTDLFNDILFRDVVVRYGLANATPIRQLAGYLLTHVGTRLSPSRLKDAIHVQAAKTVLEYFDHLSECCLIRRLERFADSPKARLLSQKKIYACDTGLINVISIDENANLGHKLENVLFNHLKTRGGDLTYYLDGSDHECDFLREAPNGTWEAIQVCWELTDDNKRREIEGLLAAMKRFGLSKGFLVTQGQRDSAFVDGCEISIVPAYDYLMVQT